jgi:hypothetical protein
MLSKHVSHMRKKETHSKYAHHATEAKGDAHYGGASPFYLTSQKGQSTESSPPVFFPHFGVPMGTRARTYTNEHPMWEKEEQGEQ